MLNGVLVCQCALYVSSERQMYLRTEDCVEVYRIHVAFDVSTQSP